MYYIKCVFVVLNVCVGQIEGIVHVVTGVGTIYGRVKNNFTAFTGIPYGDIEENDPFGEAKLHEPFSAPYFAYNDPPMCPQIYGSNPVGKLDCLRLNIYTPIDTPSDSSLPVMVYIHGGSFKEGVGNLNRYSPDFLVRNDVIIVTMNYRLGVYGFLCLPNLGYSNQGLKDIILSLKWIKNNIDGFGGDKEKILLFGHSSGAATVDYILLYNEKNVFNKAILQSGNAIAPLMVREPANEAYISRVAGKLGIDTKNVKIENVMKQLSSVNSDMLINVTRFDEFRPCVDDIFIKKIPKKVNMNNMKVMIGTTNKEMLCFYREDIININRIEQELDIGFVDLPESAVSRVKRFYSTDNISDSVIDFGTDFNFKYPLERSIRYYLANNATVYRYLFSYDGGRNYLKRRDNITRAGAVHADELGYLYQMNIFADEITFNDNNVINTMTVMWTNFAKFGNPTPENSDVLQLWPKLDNNTKYYMNIDLFSDPACTCSVQEGPYQDRMIFWDQFYEEYGECSTGIKFAKEFKKTKETIARGTS